MNCTSSILEQENVSQQESKVYLAEDIQKVLCIGRSKTYQYLEKVYTEKKPFRVIKIGKLFRVPKESFDNWFYGKEETA